MVVRSGLWFPRVRGDWEESQGAFWDSGNVLYSHLGYSYSNVHICKKLGGEVSHLWSFISDNPTNVL